MCIVFPCSRVSLQSLPQIPRNIHDHHLMVSEEIQLGFQQRRTLVVKKVVVPVLVHFFRNDDGNLPVGMFLRLLVDVLKQRLQNKTIGRRNNIKFWRRESTTLGWGIHELLPRLKTMITLVLPGGHAGGLETRRYV